MIHVQIAGQVTAEGVDGIRWVLLEAAEEAAPVHATSVTPSTLPADAALAAPGSAVRAVDAGSQASAAAPVARPAEGATEAQADGPFVHAGGRGLVSLTLLKGVVLGLALAAALWGAQAKLGPPTLRWWAPEAAPQPEPLDTSPLPTPPAPPSAPAKGLRTAKSR